MYAPSLSNYALHFYIGQGTTPFMSWAILMAEAGMHAPVKHRPVHDIESIFYVMLYFCMQFKGPGIRRTPKDIKALMPFVFNDWFLTNLTFRGMADKKWTDLQFFKECFIDKFDSYFDDLKPCVLKLYDILWPLKYMEPGLDARNFGHSVATHDKFIKHLDDVYRELPDHDNHPTAPSSQTQVQPPTDTVRPPTDTVQSPPQTRRSSRRKPSTQLPGSLSTSPNKPSHTSIGSPSRNKSSSATSSSRNKSLRQNSSTKRTTSVSKRTKVEMPLDSGTSLDRGEGGSAGGGEIADGGNIRTNSSGKRKRDED